MPVIVGLGVLKESYWCLLTMMFFRTLDGFRPSMMQWWSMAPTASEDGFYPYGLGRPRSGFSVIVSETPLKAHWGG